MTQRGKRLFSREYFAVAILALVQFVPVESADCGGFSVIGDWSPTTGVILFPASLLDNTTTIIQFPSQQNQSLPHHNGTACVQSIEQPVPMPLVDVLPLPLPANSTNGTALAVMNREYGAQLGLPFTTKGAYANGSQLPTNEFPWSATGRLMKNGEPWCTASLIAPGVAVTAAHCVAVYGTGGDVAVYKFQPASFGTDLPFGEYPVLKAFVPLSWLNGTDECNPAAARGISCENDLAVLELGGTNGYLPGELAGFYDYATSKYFSVAMFYGQQPSIQLTQLGYPKNIDDGEKLIRTDAVAALVKYNNLIMGSGQLAAGAGGGPAIANFGSPVSYQGGTDLTANVVVGTVSYAYNNGANKAVGISQFGKNSQYSNTTNIQSLVNALCTSVTDTAYRTRLAGTRCFR